MDTQLDDGSALTGTVRALLQTGPNPTLATGVASGPEYAENGTNQYLLCKGL